MQKIWTEEISEVFLENKGWKKKIANYGDIIYESYEYSVDNVHMILSKDSNMIGRDWFVHVDNWDFETIGGCSVQTVEHFNMFMTLLNIKYEL